MQNRFSLNNYVKQVFITPSNISFKFGYYNYSPINVKGDKLLAHKIGFEGRMPLPDDKVEVGFFSLNDGRWHKIANSNAFNWQQGSMLQWLGPDFDDRFIFNDVENNRFVARIYNINTGGITTIPHPVYGIDPKGEFSISLNFERCYFTRAYSYASIVNQKWNTRIPEEDGIFKVDLSNGRIKRIISLKQILDLESASDDGETMHWFEHIMLNPSGTRFAFYHRFGTSNSFKTRVYTSDINGKEIWEHPYNEGERFSHLGWIDDNRYVLYTNTLSPMQKKIQSVWVEKNPNKGSPRFYVRIYRKYFKHLMPRKIIKSIPKSPSFYALTKDRQGVLTKINPWPGNMDGHPSFTKNGKFMLTDTYADKDGYRHLLLYDLQNQKTIRLGKFYSTFNNCGWRADLHPRFSPDEKLIIIDSTHNGYHQMVVLKIDWDRLKHK